MTARRPSTPRPGRSGGAAPATRTPATGVSRPAAGRAPAAPGGRAGSAANGRGAGRTPSSRGAGTAPSAATSAARNVGRSGAARRPSRSRPVVRPTTMLAGVLVVLALTVVPMLRPWIAQRQELAAEQQNVSDLRRSVAELTAERNRWRDPAYVKAQAGERLNFVMPGQIRYTLLDASGTATSDRDPRTPAAGATEATDSDRNPWYGAIWESARAAGREDG